MCFEFFPEMAAATATTGSDVIVNSGDGGNDTIILYYNKFSGPSRKALIALYEKNVEFTPRHMDLLNREQHERWYLLINPRGEVPVLQHGETVVTESSRIVEYVSKNLGSGNDSRLFPRIPPVLITKVEKFIKMTDAIPSFPLTYGCVLYHSEHVTETLRYPYSIAAVRDNFRKLIDLLPVTLAQRAVQVSDIEAGKVLAEKAAGTAKVYPIMRELELYQALLGQVEALLDEVESELNADDHLGPWLCGPTFTAADIGLTCLLFRLYQIGLDDKYWNGGVRPGIAVYVDMAFQRPSVEKATEYSLHKHETFAVPRPGGSDQSQLNSAYLGLGAAIALGAVYAYKKLKR